MEDQAGDFLKQLAAKLKLVLLILTSGGKSWPLEFSTNVETTWKTLRSNGKAYGMLHKSLACESWTLLLSFICALAAVQTFTSN